MARVGQRAGERTFISITLITLCLALLMENIWVYLLTVVTVHEDSSEYHLAIKKLHV